MALYFLDSSAIVKRYFQEPGHEWIEMLHDPAQGHVIHSDHVGACLPDYSPWLPLSVRAERLIPLSFLKIHQDARFADVP
jgi:hypothetical protein